MAIIVGEYTRLYGNITKLEHVGAKAPGDLERWLGYETGRLSEGYAIALLAEPLSPDDFEFDGDLLRSGGKWGQPQSNKKAEEARPRVHDEMKKSLGAQGYRDQQMKSLKGAKYVGRDRLMKIVPVTSHDFDKEADVQYPMGLGADAQWKILKPGKAFLVAAFVDGSAYAHTPTDSYYIGFGAPYENRAKLMRYLSEVKART